MKRLAIVLGVLLALPAALGAETVNRIAAVVNKEIITSYQLEQELDKRRALGQLPEGGEPGGMRGKVLDQLIEEALVGQRVAELGLKASDAEVDAAIEDVQRQNKLTREQLEQALLAQGMDFDDYRQKLRAQILRFKLIGREVGAKVEVTSQELRDYFREHIDEYREDPAVRLARLSLPLPEKATEAQRETLRASAAQALERVRGGEDFFAVLQDYSADGRAQGGDMGYFDEGALTPAFEEAIVGLEAEQVSELVETPQGFHLLKVLERTPGKVRQFDSLKEEITEILRERKSAEGFKDWAEGLRQKAYIDIRQ